MGENLVLTETSLTVPPSIIVLILGILDSIDHIEFPTLSHVQFSEERDFSSDAMFSS